MISSIVVFVLAFAALGLLLGFAETYHVQPQHNPASATNTSAAENSNSSSFAPGKQTNVQAQTPG